MIGIVFLPVYAMPHLRQDMKQMSRGQISGVQQIPVFFNVRHWRDG